MAKYSIQITRVDEYEIEVDETIWTSDEIKKWENVFYPTSDTEDFAKHLAYAVMRSGSASGFMEGFGNVRTFRSDGSVKDQFGESFKKLTDDDYTKGLSVKVICEGDDYDHEITELH